MSIKRTAAAVLIGLCLTTATVACSEYDKDDAKSTTTEKAKSDGTGSGDVATREEFIAQIRESQGEAFTTQVQQLGIDEAKASAAYDAFIGCTYDAISDDPDLVERALATDAPEDKDLDTTLRAKAEDCQNTFNADIGELRAAVPTTLPASAPTTVAP